MSRPEARPTTPPYKPKFEPKDSRIPNQQWREKALSFLTWTQKQLRENAGAMDYLKGRGLSEETIQTARLGFNPKVFWLDRGSFGLPPETNSKTGKLKKL